MAVFLHSTHTRTHTLYFLSANLTVDGSYGEIIEDLDLCVPFLKPLSYFMVITINNPLWLLLNLSSP